jgi:Rrf2 family protein
LLLSQTAEYALRAMSWLATLPEGDAVPTSDLSSAADIPPHYLSKIMRRLVLHGLLKSQRGHGGGFSLAKPPEEIPFIDILAAVDAAPTPGRCAFGWGECDASKPCPMHDVWSKMSDAFLDWASTTTLADIQSTRRVRRGLDEA